MTDQKPAPTRGRPPSLDIEQRAFSAAIALYSELGWGGFTFDGVASRGRIGKAALYRRWGTRQELLVQAVNATAHEQPRLPDSGSIRVDLREYAESSVAYMNTQRGMAELRLQLEAKIYPEVLGRAMDSSRRLWIATARHSVLVAIDRGELPEGTSTSLVFDTIRGAIINRFLMIPSDREPDFTLKGPAFVDRLVTLVLAGIGATPAPSA